MQHVSIVGKVQNTKKEVFNFKETYDWWAICHNGEFPIVDGCLSQLVFRYVPSEINR